MRTRVWITKHFHFQRINCRGAPSVVSDATRIPSYKSTERVAVRVVPLYEAEIVAEVEMRTMDVWTVKVALLAPAGTSTLKGTLAAPLLLESMTCTPPAGATLLKVTVPVENSRPPTTLEGFSVSEVRDGGGGGAGVTVSEADRDAPP